MYELPEGTLFPDINLQYDPYIIREALHNCIAHMDYRREERISVVEESGSLTYYNGGIFAPGSVEEVLQHNGPQRYYRNRCLCNGMVNFNMIDTIGRGIRRMFNLQRKRFFPLPDYLIDQKKFEVKVVIYGKTIDDRYSKVLKENQDLTLTECIWLDAIQKRRPVTHDALRALKRKKLIEGRSPYYTISLGVAKATDQLGHYTKEKGLSEDVLISHILQLAKNAGENGFKRKDVLELLKDSLPQSKSPESNEKFITRLLDKIAKKELIEIKNRKWFLTDKGDCYFRM